jgi:hypothetical protein
MPTKRDKNGLLKSTGEKRGYIQPQRLWPDRYASA